MSLRTVFTSIRHKLFGKPLTPEEVRGRHEAAIAAGRRNGEIQNDTRSRSVQNQSFFL
ncbi:MAG TPA: hypothetical protein VIP50_00490 [Agromyces sp.]